ncbi:MAG: tetratricopeptide repeat protein, partial [Bacteroidota bacterium]
MIRSSLFVSFALLASVLLGQVSSDSAQVVFDKIYTIESTDPKLAIKKYIDLIPELNQELDKGRAYSYIGMVQLALGRYDSLDFYMDQALDIFEKEQYDRGLASVQNTLGNADLYRGYYYLALAHYQRALPYYEQEGQEYNLTVILNNMAAMFQHNE